IVKPRGFVGENLLLLSPDTASCFAWAGGGSTAVAASSSRQLTFGDLIVPASSSEKLYSVKVGAISPASSSEKLYSVKVGAMIPASSSEKLYSARLSSS